MFAVTIDCLPWDPLFYLSDEILETFPAPEAKKAKQKTMQDFGFSSSDGGAAAADKTANVTPLSLIGMNL